MSLLAIPIKIFENSPSERYIYLSNKYPNLLTFYNVPLYVNKETIVSLIEDQIKNTKLTIQDGYDENGKYIAIKYNSNNIKEKIQRFFQNSTEINPIIIYNMDDRKPSINGYKKYCKDYKDSEVINVAKLNEEIDKYMAEYDGLVEKENAGRAKAALEGIEEGWTLVHHKNARGTKALTPQRQSLLQSHAPTQRQKRKGGSLTNLYTTKLKKTKDCEQLKMKFEEDKARIKQMKANRKFKPF